MPAVNAIKNEVLIWRFMFALVYRGSNSLCLKKRKDEDSSLRLRLLAMRKVLCFMRRTLLILWVLIGRFFRWRHIHSVNLMTGNGT